MCYEVSSFLIDISQGDHKVVVSSCLSGIRKISLQRNCKCESVASFEQTSTEDLDH